MNAHASASAASASFKSRTRARVARMLLHGSGFEFPTSPFRANLEERDIMTPSDSKQKISKIGAGSFGFVIIIVGIWRTIVVA
jgi:hypothetical protein